MSVVELVNQLDDDGVTALAEAFKPPNYDEVNRYYGGHIPHPPQQAFLWLQDEELLYGGAAGGGKSDALLMGALQYVHIPGYAALLLRRTFPMLNQAGGLIQRSKLWLSNTDAHWNSNDNRWTFPSGATIDFGHLQYDDSVERYQGAEFQYIAFDELTQFTYYMFSYMNSRLRKPEVGPLANVPLRMRAGSNPGGPGNEWVKRYFILKQIIDESDLEDPEMVAAAARRIFLPASVYDNPSLDIEASVRQLKRLDPLTRKQLLEGDWDAREPGDWVITDPSWVDAAVERAVQLMHEGVPEPARLADFGRGISLAIDWGEHTQAYVIWPLENGGVYVPWTEVASQHREPGDVSVEMLRMILECGHPITDARYDSAGVQSMRTFLKTARKTNGFERLKSTKISFAKHKKETMGYLRRLFERSALGADTQYIAIHPKNVELIRQLKRWSRKSAESDETDKTAGDDHGPDALVAGVAPIAERHRVAPKLVLRRPPMKEAA